MTKKTETATFRINQDILEKLRVDSKKEKTTLNSTINNVLSQFVEWYAPAKQAGMIPLPKSLLVKILDYLSDEQIIQVAEYMVKNEIKDILLVLKNEHNISSFMGAVESWAYTSGFPFSHEELSHSIQKYVICHGMGKNWSLYFGTLFTRMFEELGAHR